MVEWYSKLPYISRPQSIYIKNNEQKGVLNDIARLFGRRQHVREEWKDYLRNRERFGLKKHYSDDRVLVFVFNNHPLLLFYACSFAARFHNVQFVLPDSLDVPDIGHVILRHSQLFKSLHWNDSLFFILSNPFDGLFAIPFVCSYGGVVLLFDLYAPVYVYHNNLENIDYEIIYSLGLERYIDLCQKKNTVPLFFLRKLLEYCDYFQLASLHSKTLLENHFPDFAFKLSVFSFSIKRPITTQHDSILLLGSSNKILDMIQKWSDFISAQHVKEGMNPTLLIQRPIEENAANVLLLGLETVKYDGKIEILEKTFDSDSRVICVLDEDGYDFESYWTLCAGNVVAYKSGIFKANDSSFAEINDDFCQTLWNLFLSPKDLAPVSLIDESFQSIVSQPTFRDSLLRHKIAVDISILKSHNELSYFVLAFTQAIMQRFGNVIPVVQRENELYYAFERFFAALNGSLYDEVEDTKLEMSRNDSLLLLQHNFAAIPSFYAKGIQISGLVDNALDVTAASVAQVSRLLFFNNEHKQQFFINAGEHIPDTLRLQCLPMGIVQPHFVLSRFLAFVREYHVVLCFECSTEIIHTIAQRIAMQPRAALLAIGGEWEQSLDILPFRGMPLCSLWEILQLLRYCHAFVQQGGYGFLKAEAQHFGVAIYEQDFSCLDVALSEHTPLVHYPSLKDAAELLKGGEYD